jgi:nicotinamidase-related amidase
MTHSIAPTPRPIIAWIVDVQHDFMDPTALGGRLYDKHLADPNDVGATAIVPALARAIRVLSDAARVVVYTGDWHRDTDAEIQAVAPDYATTFPPHCMGASADPALHAGAAIVPTLAPAGDWIVLDRDADAAQGAHVAQLALATGRPVFLQKSRFSAFTGNAATDQFVATLAERLGTPEFVACGVATDVCVAAAVEGLAARGHNVRALTDAMWGLSPEGEIAALARWQAAGVSLDTVRGFSHQRTPRTARARAGGR